MLFSRFPGSKRKYQIWDGSKFDAVVEPFAGGGAFTQAMLRRGVRSVFLADADPWVRSVYECWINEASHQAIYDSITRWQSLFSENYNVSFELCKLILDKWQEYTVIEVAAASLVLRYVTFAGVVRVGSGGWLNVAPVADRIPALLRWQYRFPPIPKGASISISNHWGKAVDGIEQWAKDNPDKRAIALVDPPYYAPFNRETDQKLSLKRRQVGLITPCYPGHKPHDRETLEMCVNCVQRLAAIPQVELMAVTNYYSDELHQALMDVAPNTHLQMGGKLDGLNCKRASTTQFIEATWTIGVRQCEQLSLAV